MIFNQAAFWAGALFLCFFGSITDLSWILKSTIIPWCYWFYVMWFILEGRKSIFKPFLNRWYRKVASNDCYNFEVYYHENIEVCMRKIIADVRSQMEYGLIHNGFGGVKADIINNFLIQEYGNLQRHINERAIAVLKATQQYEQSNRDAIFQDILAKTLKDLDQVILALNMPQACQVV